MISIIVAYDENRVIGCDGKIPWNIRDDLQHFREVTTGHSLIMGRKTWESLPPKNKPLKNRLNIILSKSFPERKIAEYDLDTYTYIWYSPSIEDSIESITFSGEIFVIGGSEIYKEFLSRGLVDRIIATEVRGVHEGDVFFPDIKNDEWNSLLLKRRNDYNIIEYNRREN